MTAQAQGSFEVRLTPLPTSDEAAGATLGRLSIDKRFHGDLEATSTGEMLSARTGVEGSAGYVALERVTGRLHGRSGSFILQHHGIMARGVPQLSITVAPDSSTGELVGLTGTMAISIIDGHHTYDFEYRLAEDG